MANMMKFREGDTLIGQGDSDTAAYLISSGWLQVSRVHSDGSVQTKTLQAGEIVGEMGLAGLSSQRTATVTALTDGEVEVIDRGTLIRLVNMPGGALTPLLAALFSRLQTCLMESDADDMDDTQISYAKLEGLNASAKQALCNQTKIIGHLPWVFGAYRPPQTVTELFEDPKRIDVRLTGCSLQIHEQHIIIEDSGQGVLQLRIVHYGDYCLLDDQKITHNSNSDAVAPLEIGTHTLSFGDRSNPFTFALHILM